MVEGVLALREGVAPAAALGDEGVVLVLVGVLARTHEQHVLQVVRQPLKRDRIDPSVGLISELDWKSG